MGAGEQEAVGYPPGTALLWVVTAVVAGILAARWGVLGAQPAGVTLAVALLVAGVILSFPRTVSRAASWPGKVIGRNARALRGISPVYLGPRRGRRLGWTAAATLAVCFFCVGVLRYEGVVHYFGDNDVLHYCGAQSRLISVRGVVVTEPYFPVVSDDPLARSRQRTTPTICTLACEQVLCHQGWRAATGRVQLVIDEPCLQLDAGARVEAEGLLSLRRGPANPGQYDGRGRWLASGTLATVHVNAADGITIRACETRWRSRLWGWRSRLQQAASKSLAGGDGPGASAGRGFWQASRASKAFLGALLLGQRGELDGASREAFLRTGTMHFLSVSGLHVGLLAGLLWFIGRLLCLRRAGQAWLTLAGLALFLLVVPTRPPVLRAGVICAVFCVGQLTRRRTDSVNSLAFAAVVLLLLRPLDLFNAGFQLSFVVTAALVIFTGAVARGRLLRPAGPLEGLAPLDAESAGWFGYALRWTRKALTGLLAVAVVAWLVAMPLVAYHFNRIAVWGVLASVLLAPVVAGVMWLGLIKLLLVGPLPVFAGWLDGPLHGTSHGALGLINALASLPCSQINTASPPLWLVALFYVLLALAAWSVRRRGHMSVGLAAGVLVWLIVFAWWVPFRSLDFQAGELRLDVLAVGHGCAAVVQLPDGRVLCYDAGSDSVARVGDRIVGPFLRSQGIGRIDALVISHANLDHYSGVAELTRRFEVGRVYVCEAFLADEGWCVQALLGELKERGVGVEVLKRGDSLRCPTTGVGCDYGIEVLWPPACEGQWGFDTNDSSIVLRVGNANGHVLLCGDIGARPEQMLAGTQRPSCGADVVVLPHHGALLQGLGEFIDCTGAALAVASCSRTRLRNTARLQKALAGCELVTTAQCGAITLRLRPEGVQKTCYKACEQ